MMEITDVKVRLVRGPGQKVKAFCSVTFDRCFVVKDIKVIEGDKGEFIAMPSRKLSEKCGRCGRKNPIGASYCSSCGRRIPEDRGAPREGSVYSDVAHPINAECRSMMQDRIIEAYREALGAAVPVAELADEEEPIEDTAAPGPVAETEPEEDAAPRPTEEDAAPPAEESGQSAEEGGGSFADGIL